MLKSMLVDYSNPNSLAHRARTRRWEEMVRRFPELGDMRVLDLGGTPQSWTHAPVTPAQVVCVNLDSHHECREGRVTGLVGDACDLPDALRNERFDLVYSNSLMEHVGGHSRRQRFAETVYTGGDLHWVQTPYRYFPVEPHWLFPGMQWLPFRAKVAVVRHWPHGTSRQHRRPPTVTEAAAKAAEVELLSATGMRTYFPHSQIWFERFAGLPKSLVARS
ncbi:class I SAM-dependent methyltransferase [Streptomyces cellulosae]|uniref:Class I SAM-dependent methyltransferase n=1 Tax=Streptomyces cellulosae TaxID=1968 RepID=A0ABW7Y4P1_STRCE